MKTEEKTIESTAISLMLYFTMGDVECYNRFIEKLEADFEFRETPEQWVQDELQNKPESPIQLMYNGFRHGNDSKTNIRICTNLILSIYQLKNERNN